MIIKIENILLLFILLLLCITICKKYKDRFEPFQNENENDPIQIFSEDKLKNISNEIDTESKKINTISNEFEDIIKQDAQKCYKKNEEGNFEIIDCDEENQDHENYITTQPLIDTEKLIKLNNKLSNSFKDIPLSGFYKDTIYGLNKQRIDSIKEHNLKQEADIVEKQLKNNNKPLTQIKHIETSTMYDLEYIQDEEGGEYDKDNENNSYLLKIKNPNEPIESNELDELDETNTSDCKEKCLTFDKEKYKLNKDNDALKDYYDFESCDKTNPNQKFKVHDISIDYKCYTDDNGSPKELKNIKPSNCLNSIDKYLLPDNKSYIKKYNSLIPENLHIGEENLKFLPKQFFAISPSHDDTIDDPNSQEQCLTIDDDKLSFQDSHLFENQRFNSL
jgi:hypothetical protein